MFCCCFFNSLIGPQNPDRIKPNWNMYCVVKKKRTSNFIYSLWLGERCWIGTLDLRSMKIVVSMPQPITWLWPYALKPCDQLECICQRWSLNYLLKSIPNLWCVTHSHCLQFLNISKPQMLLVIAQSWQSDVFRFWGLFITKRTFLALSQFVWFLPCGSLIHAANCAHSVAVCSAPAAPLCRANNCRCVWKLLVGMTRCV